VRDPSPSNDEARERADVRRNRRRLLDAAIDLILESGGAPTRDAVARRAGIGIATLYRHFPDQQALLRGVALDVLDRTIAAGEAALAEADDGVAAVRRYLHATIDTGLGAVNIVHALLDDTAWPERGAAAANMLERLTAAAHRAGGSRSLTASDIALASIRFCRPLSIGLGPEAERDLAHRHLDIFLDGLLPPPAPTRRSRGNATARRAG
jgi:AcrR family transcriptional regulator